MPNHQIDVAAVLVGGEQLLNDVSDTAHKALLAASGRVAVLRDGMEHFTQISELYTCVVYACKLNEKR